MRTFTKNFDTYIARAFFESFTNDPSNHYYMFASKSTPYDTSPNLPTIGKGVTSSFYDIQKDIIFGKKLTLEDISYMIKKTIHVSGTVYDQYDDKDDNIFDKNFFVFTEEGGFYSLFKCISNNYGSGSLDKPLYSRTTYSDRYYQTGDGYIWKLMTRISTSKFEKFETDNYAPLEHISEISSYAVGGSIDNIIVEEIGANYSSFAYGSIKSVSYANNARKLVIQTDTERDIYEMPIAETSGSYYTGSDVYIWSFTPTQAANTEYVVSTIVTQDYDAVS